MLNIHHLELFYYVARHGGISQAARLMPYGIQQPAISKQIALLEKDLGTRLFERQPFQLTAAGQELYGFARRFFDVLEDVADRVRTGNAPLLRVAASELVLGEYLPVVTSRMREREPDTRLQLRAAGQEQMLAWLASGEIDLAIAAFDRIPADLECLPAVRLPLVLLAPKQMKVTSAESLWTAADRRLVCPPPTEGVCRLFQAGLRERGVVWPATVQTNSTAMVTWYVAEGHGVGLSLDLPRLVEHPKVQVIPLPGFAPVQVAAVWRASASKVLQSLVSVMADRARELWPRGVVEGKR